MATDLHTAANRLLKAWDLNDLIHEHIEALRQALANEALDKMAENARELGLDYEPSSVIKLAREAGIRDCTCNGTLGCLDRFAELVRADEREACAKLCEELLERPSGYQGTWEGYGKLKTQMTGLECAAAIRARRTHDES